MRMWRTCAASSPCRVRSRRRVTEPSLSGTSSNSSASAGLISGTAFQSAYASSFIWGGHLEGTHGGLDRDSSIGFFMSDHDRPGMPAVLTVTDVLEPFADLERCRTPDAQVTTNGPDDNNASPESAGN